MVVNNPNNWHWVDKNCMAWAKNYFNEKLVGLKVNEGSSEVGVKDISSVEGDVEVCQRKGKVISLFDLKLVINVALNEAGEQKFTGSITVPELAYDSEAGDLQFDISLYNETKAAEKYLVLLKKELIPELRKLLAKFGNDLIVTHSGDIQLASDEVNSTFTKANQTSAETSSQPKSATPEKASPKEETPKTTSGESKSSSGPKYNTSTLHLEPVFNCPAEQLYITLLEDSRIAAWTRSYPSISKFPPPEGSEFGFFGNSVTGKFIKLIPNERIVQLWRLENWKSGHFAELDIQFVQGAGETKMVVKFSGIPVGEEDRVRGNFEDYYVRSIKITFGFGAVL